MSYQVLARKWRPQNFIELAGQDHVLQALMNALTQQRLHHAYLFTGTRGVGKTTIARIFAKCLNCETNGISPEPCGHCDSCQEITEGRFVDLIEVDAASRTKVEDTRELLENVQYAPTRGRFKVYLIDEVHMLSTHSFNALLKTLEEPPEHVKFLLATTDPQKLPVTILSRCLQFNLKNMSSARVVDYLQKVLTTENVGYEEAALWQIGQAADGSMRDALSLTDQAISFGNGNVKESDVTAMLGLVNHRQIVDLLEKIATNDAATVLQRVNQFADYQADYQSICASLLDLLHRIAIEQQIPGALEDQLGDLAQVQNLAASLTSETVQVFYQTLLIGKRDLPLSPSLKSGFEMLLLRLMAFRPSAPVQLSDNPEDAPAATVLAQAPQTDSDVVNLASDSTVSEKKTLNEIPSEKTETPQVNNTVIADDDAQINKAQTLPEQKESEQKVLDTQLLEPSEQPLLETPEQEALSEQAPSDAHMQAAHIESTFMESTHIESTHIESDVSNLITPAVEVAAEAKQEVVTSNPNLTAKSQATVNKNSEAESIHSAISSVNDEPNLKGVDEGEAITEADFSKNESIQMQSQLPADELDGQEDIDADFVTEPADLFELVTNPTTNVEQDSEHENDALATSESLVNEDQDEIVIAKNGVEGVYTVDQTIAQPALGLSVARLSDFSELTMQLWWLIAPRLPLKGLVHNIVMNTYLLEASSQGIKLEVPLEYGHMLNQIRYEQIQQVLSDYFDQAVPLIIDTVENVSGVTAEEFAASKRAEAMQAAVNHLNEHPIVQALHNAMGAELIYETVKVKA